MGPIRKIAIVVHENEPMPLAPRYIAAAMGEAWCEMGLEVELVRGPDASVEADLWLPNVNLTLLPAAYQRLFEGRPRVVNRAVIDISKRRISGLLVEPGDGYDGPVIVKSNANFGGIPERRLLGAPPEPVRRRLGRALRGLRSRMGFGSGFDPSAPLDPRRYPVFDRPDALPSGTFENPDLVVERFVPEMRDGLFVLRSYAFGGDAEVNVCGTSKNPVVKAGDLVHRTHEPVPEECVAVRERLGIDFGKLDYVMQDGRVCLLDVNRTPTFANVQGGYGEEQRDLARRFARGLIDRFEKEPPGAIERGGSRPDLGGRPR